MSIVEVANVRVEKEKWRTLPDIEEKLDNLWGDTSLVKMIEFQEFLARKARKLMRNAISKQYQLKGPDAIHLASAEFVGVSEFLTYDKRLFKYAADMSFPINIPTVRQKRLFTDSDFEVNDE